MLLFSCLQDVVITLQEDSTEKRYIILMILIFLRVSWVADYTSMQENRLTRDWKSPSLVFDTPCDKPNTVNCLDLLI